MANLPSPVPTEIHWSGMTHMGRVRTNNEDAFLALTFNALEVHYLGKYGAASFEARDFVFAVSDGMGGGASGEFASRIAVEKITRLLPRSFKLGAVGIQASYTDILSTLFTEIHEEMIRLGLVYEECRTMGATLSLAWFTPGSLFFAHIGDSRIYYLPKNGQIRQLTNDHTHVGWLRRQGKLNERQQRAHPRRNALQQALGAEQQFLDPHIGSVVVEPGDRFLLCTDGLVDALWDRELEEILANGRFDGDAPPKQTIAEQAIQAALAMVPRDNLTAVAVEVRELGGT